MGRPRQALEDPARQLADRLRVSGHSYLATRLSETIPEGDIAADDHRSLLAEQLTALADNLSLDHRLRAEAARLAGIAEDLPLGIGRCGTVWIVWIEPTARQRALSEEDPPSFYYTSWQPSEDGEHDLYEDGPNFPSLAEALTWASRRTENIVVRPAWDPGVYHRAGTGTLWDDMPPLIEPS